MTREAAITGIGAYFDDGGFFDDLARRVAIHTESQDPAQRAELYRYLTDEMMPSLAALGFDCQVHENPVTRGGPFLVARRHEDDALPTVMSYGHGDVVLGYDDQWRDGLNPWVLTKDGARWYGRGSADNKAQHSINIAALAQVLADRGALGFNAVILIETGEEAGSPGLREFCDANAAMFAADVFIASDGPRLAPDRPTIFMGSRGTMNFDLTVDLREGGHHSGNWGGLLANPGIILAHAIASLTTASGEILVPEWRPPPIPNSVRAAVAGLEIDGGENAPAIDPDWGEPGLSAAEKVFAWNTFEVLAFTTGTQMVAAQPVNVVQRAARKGDLSHALCRAEPGRGLRASVAPASRCERLRYGRDHARGRQHGGDPPRPRPPLGALGGRLDRVDLGQDRRRAAQPGRLAAQRRVRRAARPADHLGAAFLRVMLAARAQRTHPGSRLARGARNHDRPVLGPRRPRHAGPLSGGGQQQGDWL